MALLCAREFACEVWEPVEYYPRLSGPQEQSGQSLPCVVPEVQRLVASGLGRWDPCGHSCRGRTGCFRQVEVLPSGKLSVCSAGLCQRGQRDQCRGQDGRLLIADAEDEEFWKRVMPGTRLLVFYVDDDVWHGRMLVRRVAELFATPDHTDTGGVYVENLKPGEDISRLQGLSPQGHRPYLEESIYAFAEPVCMDRLRELVETSEPLARKAAGPQVRVVSDRPNHSHL